MGEQETMIRIIALIFFIPLFVGIVYLIFYFKDKAKTKLEELEELEESERNELDDKKKSE